ncbi:MAG: BrnT family toxin [Thermomicrobiales bacterium]|nr:BrnT family toxin [Thermomicrobiales bacterium]
MGETPRITALEWDSWNSVHVTKHGLARREAEEALFGDPVVRETYKNRFQFIGPTQEGKLVSVVVGPNPHLPGVFYVFSARPADRKEQAYYEATRNQSDPDADG